MPTSSQFKPKLRPIEAFPLDGETAGMIGVRDPSNLSPAILTVSPGALQLIVMMDGQTTCDQIRAKFLATFGQVVTTQTLDTVVQQLEQAHLLEGESFEAFYASLLEGYRTQPTRSMPSAAQQGIVDDSGDVFRKILSEVEPRRLPGEPKGIIAPHLDYSRGRPCYAAAYATLQGRSIPDRVVILGTNHFGRSTSVVLTGKDFETPFGITPCDRELVHRLESRCEGLRDYEFDHAREHSIELQVAWLQHLFGSDRFKMVPVLCPDLCGPTGTKPADGKGVDLADFARVLGEEIVADGRDTLLVAGADLSHVGMFFGEERKLDEAYLGEVRQRDLRVLDAIEANDPQAFLRCIRDGGNPTHVCSTGCIFTLTTALPDAAATILDYHQAVVEKLQNCVTCAAVAFT
jgi:AmmeMemoRadiSam system protein B